MNPSRFIRRLRLHEVARDPRGQAGGNACGLMSESESPNGTGVVFLRGAGA